MKILILIVTVATFFSCNNKNKNNETATSSTKDSVKITSTEDKSTQGKLLESEFKNFIAVLTSKDKDKIKQLFKFPVADSMLRVYIDDSGREIGYNNKGMVSEDIFIKKFDKIYAFWMVDEFNEHLKKIQLDSLSQGKKIYYEEAYDKTKPCYKFSSLHFENDTLRLGYGTNTNPDFVTKLRKAGNKDEAECAEVAILWEFKFDGKKLIFIRQLAAG